MALKRYNVTVNGRRATTTVLQLSDEEAERLGLTDADLESAKTKAAASPRNKAAKPAANKKSPEPTPPAAPTDPVAPVEPTTPSTPE